MKITSAKIVPPQSFGDMAKVIAKFEDGTEKEVVRYFSDEISFTESEVVGLTESEVSSLKFKKDSAYLQS